MSRRGFLAALPALALSRKTARLELRYQLNDHRSGIISAAIEPVDPYDTLRVAVLQAEGGHLTACIVQDRSPGPMPLPPRPKSQAR